MMLTIARYVYELISGIDHQIVRKSYGYLQIRTPLDYTDMRYCFRYCV